MSATPQKRNTRFDLVTAGHRFLFDVLPFRRPDSERALTTFIAVTRQLAASRFDIDTVLVRCLAVLSMRTTHSIPSLVDQYLLDRSAMPGDLDRFAYCLERMLRFRVTSDGAVQDAIQLVCERFGSPKCSPHLIAASLGKRLSTLDVSFKAQMGCTLTEHVRRTRLERAAMLLAVSNKSIKEIWVEVGYTHHSNFDHDFKRRFGSAPRTYRGQVIRPVAQEFYANRSAGSSDPSPAPPIDPGAGARVLIVDTDDATRTALRDFLSAEGHSAFTAATGMAALVALERCPPDVVLMEYRLADGDAVDLLARFRRHPNGATPRALIFTADWDAFDCLDEFNRLHAIVESKLCDPDRVRDFISSASPAMMPV